MKLSRIFFTHLLILLWVLFLVISIVSYYTLAKVEIDRYKDVLKKSILLLEPQLQSEPQSKIKQFRALLGERITLIAPDGNVIAESDYNKEEMENHATRPEILQAKKEGWGSAVRHSATLQKDLLYVAKLRKDGSFLRTAIALETIRQNFLMLWLKFLGIFGLFVVVALGVSYLLSRRIDREISKIVRFLEDLSNKRYGWLRVDFAKEFEIIGSYLNQLARRLKRREEKKEKFTKKIKQLSRQRSDLISAVSHEFKNPIAIMKGYAQTLMEDSDIPHWQRQRFLQKIYAASDKLTYMIDRLTLAIRMESGKLVLQKSRFDLCEVAKEAAKFLQERYKDRVILVECAPSQVIADRQMILTVIENLIDNALKYSENEVVVRVVEGEVSVEDKGVGLKPEQIDKITKKFYRVQNSWDNSMGLGLFIVSYLLELHESTLKIESEYGKGSRFSFRLNTF